MITGAWALQRQQYGEQPHWMISVLACMLGEIGLPGGGFGLGYSAENGIGNPVQHHKWPALDQFKNPVSTFIPVARTSDMLLNPGDVFSYNGKDIMYPDIKLVYWAGGNPFHHQMNLKKLTKAFKKPDTVIVNEICGIVLLDTQILFYLHQHHLKEMIYL
jgi:biotin/methionine sulfoxide reductase